MKILIISDVHGSDIVLVGHTHLPFVKRVGSRTGVNPGSLGQAKQGGPDGSYTLRPDGEVTLHKVPCPVDRTMARIRALSLPAGIADALEDLLRTGNPPTP